MHDDEDDSCDSVFDVVLWCCVWCYVVMLYCDVMLWCYVVMLCCDVMLWCCVVLCCDVVCDDVWDVVCDGVSGGECCGMMNWMILSC